MTDLGFTRMQAASAIGNLILCSGFARLPIGFVGDRIEPRWIMTIALAGMGVAMIGIWKAPENLGLLLAVVSIPVLAGIIYVRFGSYDIPFIYVVTLTLVSALLATALVPPKKTKPPLEASAVGTGGGS